MFACSSEFVIPLLVVVVLFQQDWIWVPLEGPGGPGSSRVSPGRRCGWWQSDLCCGSTPGGARPRAPAAGPSQAGMGRHRCYHDPERETGHQRDRLA